MDEFVMRHMMGEEIGEAVHFTPLQKEIIFKEILCRVRENLNTVASIMGLQLLQAEDEQDLSKIEVLRNNKMRLNTFSLLQELSCLKYQDRTFKAYLYDILGLVEQATDQAKAERSIQIDEHAVTQHQKRLLGSIVAELYAGRCVTAESVKISLSEHNGKHLFFYREKAACKHASDYFSTGDGLGIKLVELHVRALPGEMEMIRQQEGMEVLITF